MPEEIEQRTGGIERTGDEKNSCTFGSGEAEGKEQ